MAHDIKGSELLRCDSEKKEPLFGDPGAVDQLGRDGVDLTIEKEEAGILENEERGGKELEAARVEDRGVRAEEGAPDEDAGLVAESGDITVRDVAAGDPSGRDDRQMKLDERRKARRPRWPWSGQPRLQKAQRRKGARRWWKMGGNGVRTGHPVAAGRGTADGNTPWVLCRITPLQGFVPYRFSRVRPILPRSGSGEPDGVVMGTGLLGRPRFARTLATPRHPRAPSVVGMHRTRRAVAPSFRPARLKNESDSVLPTTIRLVLPSPPHLPREQSAELNE